MNDPKKQTADIMQGLAVATDSILNGGAEESANAFVILVFGMDDPERVNYVSNAGREPIITALRNAADQLEARGHGVQ